LPAISNEAKRKIPSALKVELLDAADPEADASRRERQPADRKIPTSFLPDQNRVNPSRDLLCGRNLLGL